MKEGTKVKTKEAPVDKNLTLIGICGPARVGKDTVALNMLNAILQSDHESTEQLVLAKESFATPLKSMVAMFLDFAGYGSIMRPAELEPYIDGELKEEKLPTLGKSPRQLMQTLGTDWGRNMIDPAVWITLMQSTIEKYGAATEQGFEGAVVIIPDVRFDNEAEVIKNNGGTIIRMTSTRDLETVDSHISEAGVSDCMVDITLANDGELPDLRKASLHCIEDILGYKLPIPDGDLESEVIKMPEGGAS